MPIDLDDMGSVSGPWDLIDGALHELQIWLPGALTKFNEAHAPMPDGGGFFTQGPQVYGRIPEQGIEMVADQLPCVFVSCTGASRPHQFFPHALGATFNLHVVVLDRDTDWGMTSERIHVWAALVRTVLFQHQQLNGVCNALRYVGEEYLTIGSPGDARTYAGATITFEADISCISEQALIGPLTLPPTVDPKTGLATHVPDGPIAVAFEDEVDIHGPVP